MVAAIFISACVAGYEAVARLIDQQAPTHLVALAVGGAIGYVGNGSPPASGLRPVTAWTVRRWSLTETTLARALT